MQTRFLTTPEPPIMLTPAASDQAMRTIYTGIRMMTGIPIALRSEAMTRGNSV
jgi:hypothetical protein